MARRKLREARSKFFGTRNVIKDLNMAAHAVIHDLDPSTSTNTILAGVSQVIPAGYYFGTPTVNVIGSATSAPVNGRLRSFPLFIGQPMRVSSFAIQITGAGTAGVAKWRGTIYSSLADLTPGALVLDTGQQAADATGIKEAAINVFLNKGVYWIGLVTQGAPAAVPTYQAFAGSSFLSGLVAGAATAMADMGVGYQLTGVTAAPPDPYTFGSATVIVATENNVSIQVKRAT